MNPQKRFSPPDRHYDGYVFDCDGTLADSMPLHFAAWRHALKEAGARFDFSWHLFEKRAGMSLEGTVEELAQEFSVALDPRAVADAQRRHFASLESEMVAVVDVLAFARKVAKHSPVAVASGSSRPSVERTLTLIGARELFPIIVTPEDVERGKPHPDMFLLAAQKMDVERERCLVLEDAQLGFEAARRAGMDYAIVLPPFPTGA